MKLKVLDLFSGIGGFSLGLERTGGFETVAFCEIEEFPRRVLKKHWPEVMQYHDVRQLTADVLERDGITGIDVITGGFPCQDLSVAGRQAGIHAERSGLFGEIIRLIGELRPSYVILENVANMLRGPTEQRGAWFGHVLGQLAECGYDAEWENIPASAVGAPHRRERVWIVCYPNQDCEPSGTINAEAPERSEDAVAYPGEDGSQEHGGLAVNNEVQHLDVGSGKSRAATNSIGIGQQGQGRPINSICEAAGEERKANRADYDVRWPTQPAVRRRDDGVPRRVDADRIAALGNSVVPQIPEIIGKAIMLDLE